MKGDFWVIDSDMHLVEPADLWQKYMEPAYRDRAPVGTEMYPRDIGVLFGTESPLDPRAEHWMDAIFAHSEPLDPEYQHAIDKGWDGKSQLWAMDQEGVDIAVLYPSRGLFVMGLDSVAQVGESGLDPDFAAALGRAYNNWLYDFCDPDRQRLYGAAMVAPHNIDEAVKETKRAVLELGFKSIFLLPGRVNDLPWHHPNYDPLWRTCEELDIPVGFHGGGPDKLGNDFGLGNFEMMMMWHSFSHCLGPMSAMVNMIGGGVFDRFPKLRVGFLEANCSWAPWLVHRLEDHYEDYIGRFEIKLDLKPSEYYQRNCFVSVEGDEKPAIQYVDALGDNNVVFSTDYPHPDSKFPHAADKFLTLDLPDESKRKFLWDNCARLYNIDKPK
ncbi:MAG: amidohydrolase [Porticoccaceae bacterium]|nr:amidohydrolase [Porticoccaceae bacterium]